MLKFVTSIILIMLMNPIVMAADSSDMAIRLVSGMLEDVSTIANSDELNEKASSYCEIINEYIDVQEMGAEVIGSYWKRAKSEDKEAFINAFRSEIAQFFMGRFESYLKDASMTYPEKVPDRKNRYEVKVEINTATNSNVTITFVVNLKEDVFMVSDAKLLGTSFRKIKKSEYKPNRRNLKKLAKLIEQDLAESQFPVCL